jgi:hypothetical protein
MKKLVRWFRVVSPPLLAWLACSVTWTLAAVTAVFSPHDPSNRNMWVLILPFAAGSYGVYRIMHFHPADRPDYQAWLRTTPWRHPMSLPFGPVHIIIQDLLILGVLCAVAVGFWQSTVGIDPYPFAHHPHVQFSSPARAVFYTVLLPFLAAYLIVVALTIKSTGQTPYAVAIEFGLGLMVLLCTQPLVAALTLLATYAVAYVGIERSLAAFPWTGSALESISRALTADKRKTAAFGWPYHQLKPSFEPLMNQNLSSGVHWFAPLAGWWTYSVLSHFAYIWRLEEASEVIGRFWTAFRILVFVLAGVRIAGYCVNHWAPISLLGRLVTGRWIIPGYDQVFVAPIATIAAGLTMEFLFRYFDVGLEWALSISVTVVIWLAVSIGPSLERWHLTGSLRLMRW